MLGDTYFDDFTQLVLYRLNQDAAAAATQAQLVGSRRTPTFFQIARVAAAFNLEEPAVLMLTLLTAADQDPRIWVIARSHHRDPSRVGIDCATAAIALDLPVPVLIEAAERLRRLDLITTTQTTAGYRPFVAMFAVPRIVDVIVGDHTDDEDLIGIVAPSEPAVGVDTLVVPDTAVASLRAVMSRRNDNPPVVIMQGTEGVGKRALVNAIAAELQLATLVIDALELPHEAPALRRVLAALAREARLSDAIIFVDNADALAEQFRRQAVATMLGVLVRSPVLASTGGQVDCMPRGRPVIRIDLSLPAATDRVRLWSHHLEGRSTPEVCLELADRYPITPGLIARASSTAKILTPGAVEPEHVKEAIGSELSERFRGIGKRVEKHERWEDLVLSAETSDAITELIGRARHTRQVVDDWGFGAKMAKGLGLSALFSGEPGTGKTMVAALIAKELGLQLYQIDLANLVSKYIGETEKNLARAFDAAEAGHAVLLFDEADALFGKRTSDVKSSTDRYANMETNYLLQRVERFSGVAILTTNLITSIDPAFQRRIAVHVRFEMPDEDVRTRLWERLLPAGAPRNGRFDFRSLGRTYKFSGGFIRNAVLRAAYLAAAEGTHIEMSHLSRAADLEAWEMGRVV
ncbi:MAG: ATP-binding protein [Myxococcota bacterium]|nr:ATP-binding protein [Myxococcota bacterium]